MERETLNGDFEALSQHHDSAGAAQEVMEPNFSMALDAQQEVEAML